METLTIRIKNEKARKLIRDLEELDILEVMEEAKLGKKDSSSNISDLKKSIKSPMKEDAINDQFDKMRNEWKRDI